MMPEKIPKTAYGKHLYDLLPEVYRERDSEKTRASRNHLSAYLDSHGDLLDRLRGTIDQMYADHFPDVPQQGRVCQPWIIPYLADLVGAAPVSPFSDGRREEVANAVRWSKGKGTPRVVAEITRSITQSPSQQQEGFVRLARMVRIGDPIQPATSYGEPVHPIDIILAEGLPSAPLSGVNPQVAARHPGQPSGTIDTSLPSRAITATPGAPGSREGKFEGITSIWPRSDAVPVSADQVPTAWRQFSSHGVPCFVDSYEDQSVRTVDCRNPDPQGRIGRYHPKRFLIYLPPPNGLIVPNPHQMSFPDAADWLEDGTLPKGHDGYGILVRHIDQDGNLEFENITAGSVELTGNISIGPVGSDIPAVAQLSITFSKLRFAGELILGRGQLALERCAVKTLRFSAMDGVGNPDRIVRAHSVLFDAIVGAGGRVILEYCTILSSYSSLAMVEASEAIFPDDFNQIRLVCARYSRIPTSVLTLGLDKAATTNTDVQPQFRTGDFSQPGAGVVEPGNAIALVQGAEDGGEIGAFHDWHFLSQRLALRNKLDEFLPLGLEPVVVWDERLLCAPPALNEVES